MIIVNEIQLEGKKAYCCGYQLNREHEDWICGQYVNKNERVLCDKCFKRTFNKEAPKRPKDYNDYAFGGKDE